jgi:predicted tellurium resistance membrane protein TerC
MLPAAVVLAVLVAALLAVDFAVFARGRVPTLRESAVWSLAWLALALVFGAVLWAWRGGGAAGQYYAGYLLERSLSLDNVFVFTVILGYFAVPASAQAKVLSWGIGLALALRLVFILAGAALLHAFDATFYVFGALLLYTAYRLARHDETKVDPGHNPVLRAMRRVAPNASPMVAVFVVIAATDVIFAIDSIPAIFAITQDPFIVFAANAFAILGLRALYFLLAGMVDRFAHLSTGLAVILAFIGAKMLAIDIWHVPIWLSLGVIAAVIAASTALSMRQGHGAT